jgi:hypothetical protein
LRGDQRVWALSDRRARHRDRRHRWIGHPLSRGLAHPWQAEIVAAALIWRLALRQGVVPALADQPSSESSPPSQALPPQPETDLHKKCGSIVAHRPKPSKRNSAYRAQGWPGWLWTSAIHASRRASPALCRGIYTGLTRAPAT